MRGSMATVSARALMWRAPSLACFAQLGMRPQRGRSTLRPSSRCSTTVKGSVGATFQDGWNSPLSESRTSASKIRPPLRVRSAASSGHTCCQWWHDHAALAPYRDRRVCCTLPRWNLRPHLAADHSGSSSSRCCSWARSASRWSATSRTYVLPWESVASALLAEHAWARVGVVVFGILVVVAAIGMWRLQRWGWALMITLVATSLVLDLTCG